jgi:hypothetical protein
MDCALGDGRERSRSPLEDIQMNFCLNDDAGAALVGLGRRRLLAPNKLSRHVCDVGPIVFGQTRRRVQSVPSPKRRAIITPHNTRANPTSERRFLSTQISRLVKPTTMSAMCACDRRSARAIMERLLFWPRK